MDLCLAIDRILTMPGGSLLLVGHPGMGRRAAVSLVAHMHQIQLLSLRTSSTYLRKHFSVDLKQAMQVAGVERQHVVLVISLY